MWLTEVTEGKSRSWSHFKQNEKADAVSSGPVCLTHVWGRPGGLAPSSVGVLGLGAQSTRVKRGIRIGPKGRKRESD